MAVNHYFNNYSTKYKTSEQRIYEDLIVESIQIMGHAIYYLPREDWDTTDQIFGENIESKFERAYQMEMYISKVDGYQGDGDFFSKFGLEVRENTNILMAKKTFEKYVPTDIARRPREGDLLFIPVMNKIFEIKFVEDEMLFFSLGRKFPYLYEMRCEVFRYANENMNTGIEDIDDIPRNFVFNLQYSMTGNGHFYIGETVYQGASLGAATATAVVSNWDPNNQILYINTISGEFANNSNIVGTQSASNMRIITTDNFSGPVYYDLFDNKVLQTEANNYIDFSEVNPFGTP
jgi:hypothetical protein